MYYRPDKSYLIIKLLIFAFIFLLAACDPRYEKIMDLYPSTALSARVKTAVVGLNPAPSSAVSYALSLRGRGISVGIVILGGGCEGWLQPLHSAHNPRPLLLWTSRGSSAVPQWMEGQAAYVITADSLERIQQFLEDDSEDALMTEGFMYASFNKTRRDFQLHSSVPIIMAVEKKVSRYWLQNTKGEIRQLFRVLWSCHESFRGLLIVQRTHGPWRGFVMDTLKKKREQTLYQSTVDKAVASVQAQATLRTRDLGGHKIVFFFEYSDKLVFHLKGDIGNKRVYSPNVELIYNLQELFKFSIKYHDLNIDINDGNLYTPHYIAAELALRILDFSAMPFSLNEESLNFDILQATTIQSETIVLFPTPELLPAWSLPFRVFGFNLWLSLVVCVVAYALAWRVVANKSLAASAAAALRALSSCGGTPQDRVRSTAQRLMLAGALLASAIVIAAAYQGRLYTLQVKAERYKGLQTLEEIVNNGLPLRSFQYWLLHNLALEYLNTSVMEKENEDVYRYFTCNVENSTGILERKKKGELFAWIIANKEWEYLHKILNVDGWSALSHRYTQATIFMHARRNWPWTDVFNRKIFQITDSGLPLHWDEEYKMAMKMYYKARKNEYNLIYNFKEEIGNMPFKFGLKEVWSLFNVLGIGLFLGTIVFVIEVILGGKQVT